ncbi:type II secretion system F family protein, partial [Desulfovibrio piger]|nr:type II secretion system F family protein [Desulfovibrio piger]
MAAGTLSPALRLQARFFFGPAVRMRAWKKLQAQMRNGMRLEESLCQLQRHARESRSPLADIYGHILTILGHGRTLDTALEGLATREEIMLIGSGISTGKLPEGLGLAIKVLNAQTTIRKSVRSSLTGPVISLVACIALFVFVAVHIMPQLML